MSDLPFRLLFLIWLFLMIPFVSSVFFSRYLKLSPFFGYVVGGVIINLFFRNLFPKQFIGNFSILGLNLLIFTLGFQINFNQILRLSRWVIGGGLLQLIFSGFLIYLLCLFFKFSLIESLFLAVAFSTASTAVVGKLIQEKGEEGSLLGELALGLLIFQDVTLIPLLIILSSFGENQSFWQFLSSLTFNLIKSGFILFFVYYSGQKIVPFIFDKISRLSKELLNFLTIIFIISVLLLFSYFGISSILASFIAGIILAQTFQHYHIFAEIRPLKEIFVIIFFIFLGFFVDPNLILAHFLKISLFLMSLYLIKIFVVLFIFLFFKFHTKTAFFLALMLSGLGEDAFIILFQGLSSKILGFESYNFALILILVNFLLSPIIINYRDHIYLKIRKFIKKNLSFLEKYLVYHFEKEVANINVLEFKDHIILCGYGRVGSLIGYALNLANIPFIAVDYNYHIVEKARRNGVNIIYGDPTDIDVLDYLQCEEAKAIIVALPDRFSRETVIFNARKLNSNIVIFVRVHHDIDRLKAKDLGAHVIVQPEIEASIAIIKKIMMIKGFSKEKIAKRISELRKIY